MAADDEVGLQLRREIRDFVDRLAEREMAFGLHAARAQPVHPFLQDFTRGFLEPAARDVGQQTRALC
ncbi:hypothetical protein NO136_20865, partial [Clostridioides difficile]|nr:hypothetical protein [Clostridioides difficile]